MIRPSTFERVYAALKEGLRQGRFRPGERLEPAVLANQLNASVTPVRDALHRLTGERLVEAPRHEGFRAPLLTERMLRQLYAWHLDILLLAIADREAGRQAELSLPAEGRGDARLVRAFDELAIASSNPEHSASLRNAAERLEPYQRLEPGLLAGIEAETDQIVAAIGAHDRTALRRALIRYHRRRQSLVPELLDKVREHRPDRPD